MTRWFIVESPEPADATPDNALWIGDADTALEALDAFAIEEGFVPYSEIAAYPDEFGEFVGVDPNGRTWAIFTNTTVWAHAVENRRAR